jgi:Type II/IV secretion system protein
MAGGLRTAVTETPGDDGVLPPGTGLGPVVRAIGDELTGLGPLAPLLADPAVTDVLVNGPTDIWVERAGSVERAAVRFASAAAVAAMVRRVVAPLGLRVDESRPWVDARLPGGERFHAVLPPLAPDGPVVTIRTFARRRLQLGDLIDRGALDPTTARLLEAMVAAGVAIAVSGATGTGKTTLLIVTERHLTGPAVRPGGCWTMGYAAEPLNGPIRLWQAVGSVCMIVLFNLRSARKPPAVWLPPVPCGRSPRNARSVRARHDHRVRRRKGMRRGSPSQRQSRNHRSQLPAGRRGGRHLARVAQDGVPLGQGRQTAVPEDPWWSPPLPGGRDPPAGRRAPGAADNLSDPAGGFSDALRGRSKGGVPWWSCPSRRGIAGSGSSFWPRTYWLRRWW